MAPSGYERIDLNSSIDLKNKQVYLAQVPADFDPRKAEFKSETEVTCQGTTYFVNSSASIANCDILCPGKEGKLEKSPTQLAGLLAFTKKVQLPKVDYESVTQSKPVVPQKPGLRMRHFPTGYGAESFGIDTTAKKTSRRRHSENAPEDSKEDTPRKKHKKEKHSDAEHKKKKKSHKHKHSKE